MPEGSIAATPLRAVVADQDVDPLLARVCAGDEGAWQRLWNAVEPELDALIRRRRLLGPLSPRDDERRALTLLVMDRLRQDSFRRLKLYRDEKQRTASLSFQAWLTVVNKHLAVDYLRAHPDYVPAGPRRGSERVGAVISPGPLPSGSHGPGVRPPVTVRGTAGELMDYARRELPATQHRALELWMAGQATEDIAAVLGVSSLQVQRAVRPAVERLRRRFRTAGIGEQP
jgi:DNA-directed RNA polymerase specialized sigma24 family protein